MATVYTYLTLSATREQATPIISMVQGDNGRGLIVTITDDVYVSSTAETEDTLTGQIWAKKPSGMEVSMDASQVLRYENSDSYQIIFEASDTFANMIAEEGRTIAQIILKSGEQIVSTFYIYILVAPSVMQSSKIKSSDEWANAIDLMNSLEEQQELMNQYIEQFQNQLKLTTNVRYGTGEPEVLETDKDGDLYIRIGG